VIVNVYVPHVNAVVKNVTVGIVNVNVVVKDHVNMNANLVVKNPKETTYRQGRLTVGLVETKPDVPT
jgi:hypothetical protein